MRMFFVVMLSAAFLSAATISPVNRLWDELQEKRTSIGSAHQEFDVVQTFKTAQTVQSSKRQLVLDLYQEQWREKAISGSGRLVRIFDGKSLIRMEEGDDEYVRPKLKARDEELTPVIYQMNDVEWSKAAEVERRPCSLSKATTHTCVVLRMPLKPSINGNMVRVLGGTRVIFIDLDSGLILSSQTLRTMQNNQSAYQAEADYSLKTLSYGGPADASLFRVPDGDIHEVKELSKWNAAKMKKVLVGNAAPELSLTDIDGKAISLADLKGRTVLLDFWATWCGPCRKDAPALDKLYQKYGGKDLAIVGISVSEDHAVVAKFLKEHPHAFPVALTTENEMPRAFEIGVFPTYVIIDREGKVAGAAEGGQGFGDLSKLLKKAGLEAD